MTSIENKLLWMNSPNFINKAVIYSDVIVIGLNLIILSLTH